MSRRSETALIIGAGLQGCAVALFLVRAGWSVTVLEKNVAGRHASGVNAGGLRQLVRDWREYPLAQLAISQWANLGALVGESAARLCEIQLGSGQIAVAFEKSELIWAEGRVKDMSRRRLGEEELLSQQELRRLLPGISPRAIGGLISRRDGHANPAAAARAFQESARAAGATIHENCRVVALERTAGGGWRVETSNGAFEGSVVVNCGGAWGNRIASLVDEHLPEQALALSMMVTARVQPFIKPVVIGIDRPLSFKQSAAGSLVIGGGMFGRACPDQDTSFTVMDRMTRSAAATVEAFPALAEVPVLRTWTGLEGATPDGIPIIGPSTRHTDLWHVFGFCGHGFLLAPAVGTVVARSVADGKPDTLLKHFSPGRFSKAAIALSKGAAS